MASPVRIHAGKTPPRKHFIQEWMEHRGLKARDLTEAMGVDKSVISRWLNHGNVPQDKYLEPLAEMFSTSVDGLFRHPDDDWIRRIFEGRSREERDQMKRAFETIADAIPRKTA